MSRWLRVVLVGLAVVTTVGGCGKGKQTTPQVRTLHEGRIPVGPPPEP